MKIPPIIQASELLELKDNKQLILIDASNHKEALNNYHKSHLDGAIFVDSNKQLANIGLDASKGGRHPLPSLEQFSNSLSELGITPDSHIVIYDDKSGANSAARFWWMLRAVGHKKVQVLNGGMEAAIKVGFPVNDKKVVSAEVAPYPLANWQLPLATIDELEKNSEKENYLVIDVRENNRYRGEVEPIDLVAGHIPGAVNIPYLSNLDENGLFYSPEVLKEKYSNVFKDKDTVVVHCGSGITACHTLLAIAHAGLDIPKLYVGSWSEWSRSNNPIIKEI